MPGLVAMVDFAARPDSSRRFKRQQLACRLRMGYRLEAWSAPNGFAHLGRLDLGVFNREPQPLTSSDERYALFFQGEIYDLKEKLQALENRLVPIRGAGCADLLLATYLADGLRGIESLNGSFFFALWDAHAQTLTLGGDRQGSRPHYYHEFEGRFLLAPEVSGIVAARGSAPPSDLFGIASFLAMEHPLGDATFFEGIRVFPAATFLVLSRQGTEWHSYWSPRYTGPVENKPRPRALWLEESTEHFRKAVSRAMSGPVCLPLSGGSDSRTIAALAEHRDFPVYTFGNEDSPDVIYARRMASLLGLKHHFIPLREDYLAHFAKDTIQLGEGMVSLYHAHNCVDLELAPRLAPVMVFGMTAEHFRLELLETILAERPRSALHGAHLLWRHALEGQRPLGVFANDGELVRYLQGYYWSIINPSVAKDVLAPELAQAMQNAMSGGLEQELARFTGPCTLDKLAAFNVGSRQRRFSQWGVKMSHSVMEYRKPFDDYDLVDYMLTLPPATRRLVQKEVLCQAHPGLAAIPRTGTGIPLSASYTQRALAFVAMQAKKRFYPARSQSFCNPQEGLRGQARSFYEDLLLDGATRHNGYFRPAGVEALLKAHMAGSVNAASALCALATIELWRRSYVEGACFLAA